MNDPQSVAQELSSSWAAFVEQEAASLASRWVEFVGQMANEGGAVDPNALVQAVLREAYLQTTEDLRYYAEKVDEFNRQKKIVREYLNALRRVKSDVLSEAYKIGIDPCGRNETDRTRIIELIDHSAVQYPNRWSEHELGIPDRVPSREATTITHIADEIMRWEGRLAALGDDAQLANVDLQNALQRQQQTLQMISNISMMIGDLAQSVIRKMGG